MTDYSKKPNDPLFVDMVKTPLSEAEATYYLKTAFKHVMGYEASLDTLAVMWAQTALETGRFRYLRSNNMGNQKKLKDKKYTSYECSEILNGKNQYFYPYHPQTFFAAWDTPLEGAIDHVEFLSKRTRYQAAWKEMLAGNPTKFSAELSKAGYYTANVVKYTAGVVRLCDEFKSKSAKLLAWAPPAPEPTPEPEPVKPEPVVEEKPEAPIEMKPVEEPKKPAPIQPAPKVKNKSTNIFEMIMKFIQMFNIIALLFGKKK